MQSLREAITVSQFFLMHSNTQANIPQVIQLLYLPLERKHQLGCTGLALTDVSRRQIAPTLLISAGAIVLLTCSTAFETPGKNKQIRHWSTTLVMQALVDDLNTISCYSNPSSTWAHCWTRKDTISTEWKLHEVSSRNACCNVSLQDHALEKSVQVTRLH